MSGIVKICGLRTEEALDAALDAGADWVGFVFVEKSPRFISPTDAVALARRAQGRAKVVGLFADLSIEDMAQIAAEVPLDAVQLHGHETTATIGAIKAATAAEIIFAAGIADPGDLPQPEAISPHYYLFDAAPPKDADVMGGHGEPFDWSILNEVDGSVPWLLAGGLTPDNVGDAIAKVRHLPGFAGVDVSSGVEKSRGEKDAGLIAAFVSAARAAMGD